MRGQARDYDQWVAEDNPGWSWRELLPLFRRMEDYFVRTSEMHGTGGEWWVERQRLSWKLLDAFQQATARTGTTSAEDFNNGDNGGCGYFQINQRGGVCWNASKGLLRGIAQCANLTVLAHAEIQRILLENGRARAPSVRWQGRERRFEVRRKITLSIGAIGSPCLLQRSGIGPWNLLERLGAGIVHGLPRVGGNLQDHPQLRMIYGADDVPTLSQIAGSLWGKLGMGPHYLASRSGPLSMAPNQLGTFARSDLQQPSADLEYHVQSLSLDRFGEPLYTFPALTASACDLCPYNRGTMRIRSPDPGEAPSIQPNYLSDPCDLKVTTDAIRPTRRVAAAPALAAFCPQEYKPGPEYRNEEDPQRTATEVGTTILHPAGTCRMGQGSQAMVDAQLRMHGIPGLRIADASIMPSLTSGNACSSVLMIAERATQMILAERRREAAPQVAESAIAAGGKETVET